MNTAAMIAFDLGVRVSLLAIAGALVALALYRQSAALRHLVLSASLGGSLALAVMVPWAPRLDVPVGIWRGVEHIGRTQSPVLVVDQQAVAEPNATWASGATSEIDRKIAGIPAFVRQGKGIPTWLAIWMTGAALVLSWGLIGRLGLARLVRRAAPVNEGPWRNLVDDAAATMSVRRPIRIFVSSEVSAPVTWGVRRPVLVVPATSTTWGEDIRRSVVAHEVAHVARNDYLHQVMALVTCAVYWFHPLVWAMARRMRQAAERASDDIVLEHGTNGEDYAAHLIGVARGSRSLRLAGAVAIGMARATTLEGRIVAVLDPSRPRGEPTRSGRRVVGFAAAAALFMFGALRPVPAAARPAATDRSPVLVNDAAPDAETLTESAPAAVSPAPRTQPTKPQGGVESRQGQPQNMEEEFPASPGGLLDLDLSPGGEVIIRGWDENRVVVRARLDGDNWRDIDVNVDRQSNGVLVRARYARRMNTQSTMNSFEIRVPRRYDVRISSGGGTLTIIGIDGRFTGHTGGGGFVLERLTGSASLSTGGGEIRVSNSELTGRVQTGGGTVLLSRVSGGLRGSSGSGPVIYGDSVVGGSGATADLSSVQVGRDGASISIGRGTTYRAGSLSIDKAGGEIDLDAAPNGARVRTGGGDVRVGPSGGVVDARTGGGDVRVGPTAGSVRASTGAGEVHIVIDRMTSQDQVIEASSGKGRIIIELPRDFDGRLDLETAHTRTFESTSRIESDWDLEREPLTGWIERYGTPRRFLRASATIGRGSARVVVRTVNGEIEIRRR